MSSPLLARRWALVLNVLSVLAIVALCLSVGIGIAFSDLPDDLRRAAGLTAEMPLSWPHRAGVAALGALPVVAMVYVLSHMARLFRLYARGETLSHACAREILRTGAGLLAAAALALVARPLQLLLASIANPPGERVVAISLAGTDLGLVLAGGLLISIGWTLGEAARIADENRAFV